MKRNEHRDKRQKELEEKLDLFNKMKYKLDYYKDKLKKYTKNGLIIDNGYSIDGPNGEKN